jgi:para-nitrobenzyl esterase
MTDVLAYTNYGKIRGVYFDGVYRFLGVRYAKPPVGPLRFMPPEKPDVSDVVVDAKEYALKCWQTDTPRIEVPEVANSKWNVSNQKIVTGNMEMGKGPMSEDCLALNIWTPDLTEGMDLPVMVWCHGGGNLAGSAECPHQDGFNMAKKNNVVMVSFSHRLSIFGYMDLSGFGGKYAKSANLGNQDMIAVLEWVRDNIRYFGGDPGNVTIFGESGGGGKVCQLLGMPAAKGLFHKAIVQSGGFQAVDPAVGRKDTDAFLEHLGITEATLDRLETIPPADLIKAMREVNAGRENGNYLNFPVTFDGEVIQYDPFDGGAGSEYCKDIPLIICYTREDMALLALFNPEIFDLTWETLPAALKGFGYNEAESAEIISVYKELLPDPTAPDIVIALMNDARQLKFVEDVSRTKDGKGGAPFYNCVFAFESPDPVQKAFHGTDVPFFFDNAYLAPGMYTAKTKAAAFKVSDTCGSAWASFARTGDPTGRNMPSWLPYDQKDRFTMIIQENSKLVSNYREKGRELVYRLQARRLPGLGRSK